MSKITLPTVASGYNLSVINSNFQAIEDTLNDSVLFRDEDVSNEMAVDLDMNGNAIYNVSTIDASDITVGGVPLVEYIAALATQIDPQDVTIARYVKAVTVAGSTVSLPEVYAGSSSSLIVFRNGVQQPTSHYTFDGTTLTFSTSLVVGEVVDVVYFKSIVGGLEGALDSKQDILISGVNIKTINGESLLGSGNIAVSGGGATVLLSDTAPSTPVAGDLWVNTLDMTLNVWYSDLSSSQWIVLAGIAGSLTTTGGGATIDDLSTSTTSVWSSSRTATEIATKQATLVSGTNIKTVNGTSLLGSGDLVVSGGGGVTDHGALTGLADDDHTQYHTDARGDARYSQLGHSHAIADVTSLQTTLDGKQATLVSGTNIKTVGGTSLLGTGDIAVGTGDVTLTGTQTLTNKTIEAGVLTNGYTEEVFAVTGTTPALSPTNGSIQTWTLSANSTPTAGTWAAGQSIILGVTASTYTVTWPSVVWSKVGGSGAAPTLTSTGVNWMILWKVGTTIYGSFMGTT